ncbi:uncharacterized protein LOC131526627 [Onychostoma macrolepis]|uniref:uncharacterized protein LOC131526627 n=1 Tax=Onychostoma macrolepis TaxID=369639 RepID=UPI00272B8532|nr:uncharacterized protein LOC131526627 [Onychostoma macrolepis]
MQGPARFGGGPAFVAAPSSAIPRPTTQAGVWPPPPPVSAPMPTSLSAEPSVQASAWPQWPAYTAPPPASLSSGPAAQACAWPHGQPHPALQPAPFGQASVGPLWPLHSVPQPTPSSSGFTAQANAWPHELPNTAPPPAPFNTLLQAKPSYSLFTATPMPVPANAIATEPPRFTEIICSVFPHRRRELNDYLAIIAELALSYGGGHFFTYHKLFSAKCAVRVAQWNQCPYWGALDLDLHNRVFLGCRNISCAVCRSVAHSTSNCPRINPSATPCPEPTSAKSTSYVPRPATALYPDQEPPAPHAADNRQPCFAFNNRKCIRHRCRFLHMCSFCGGAHARVVCPVSKAVNKKSKNYSSTPVNISRLAIELASHPDKEFCKYLLSGLSHGFNPGVVCALSQNLICNNLQSAHAEPDIVDNLIGEEVKSGFMIGPFVKPPFEIFRISPIGVATRKFSGKKRLIIDLSSPHNSSIPSINSLIPLEEFSLRYHDIDQAVELIKIAGRGAWLAKLDITSAFKVMPIHPDSWHLFGIRWSEKFYFAVRLTFGCKSSPKIFNMLSEAVCWILSNNYAIPHLIHLLDDFLIISPPDAIPAAHILTAQKVFSELGIPIAQEKTLGPATSIEFLGINLDSVKFQDSLPKEKIDRIILVSSTLIDSSRCSKRELLSLLGHLNFAMRIIPQGRPFISHLLLLASSVHALEDLISLSQECRDELRLCIMFLKQWNGLSLFYNNLVSSPFDIKLFTDAAPSIGFGGFYQGRWFASPWPSQLQSSLPSSALFELYPLVIAAFLWGNEWASKCILVHCDNEAVVQCINKGRSNSPALTPFLRRLIWISACDQFIIIAKHVAGSENKIADSLSRFLFQKFRMLAPEADQFPTPVPPYSELIFP